MRLVLALVAAVLWQVGDFNAPEAGQTSQAEPQHMLYERALGLPAGASGVACAVLDAKVYEHVASWSAADLRVFQDREAKTEVEIPFLVSYSEAQPTDAMTAAATNRRVEHGEIAFDLEMPKRPYTRVDLEIAAQDFVGTATVTEDAGGKGKLLGVFPVFDLTAEHLARSTALALQESSMGELHVVLRLRGLDGRALTGLSADWVKGALVPASREAQTLYTSVASSSALQTKGGNTSVEFAVPEHVPIERVAFAVSPEYKKDFLRDVVIAAGGERVAAREIVEGTIWRVDRAAADEEKVGIHEEKLTQDAVLASNLHAPAIVRVEVKSGADGGALPLASVKLQMRQRTLCFRAAPNARYVLRYGDRSLRAPVYDLEQLPQVMTDPVIAELGPEQRNAGFVERRRLDQGVVRRRELFWIGLLLCVSVVGIAASRHTKQQGRRGLTR